MYIYYNLFILKKRKKIQNLHIYMHINMVYLLDVNFNNLMQKKKTPFIFKEKNTEFAHPKCHKLSKYAPQIHISIRRCKFQ